MLSDPKKREIYDQGGEQAIKEGGLGSPSFSSPMDIFDIFWRRRKDTEGKKREKWCASALNNLRRFI